MFFLQASNGFPVHVYVNTVCTAFFCLLRLTCSQAKCYLHTQPWFRRGPPSLNDKQPHVFCPDVSVFKMAKLQHCFNASSYCSLIIHSFSLSLFITIIPSVSFLHVPLTISASLLGQLHSLACGPRDVVLINSPHCTPIKLPVNGPAPSFPSRSAPRWQHS